MITSLSISVSVSNVVAYINLTNSQGIFFLFFRFFVLLCVSIILCVFQGNVVTHTASINSQGYSLSRFDNPIPGLYQVTLDVGGEQTTYCVLHIEVRKSGTKAVLPPLPSMLN